MSDEIPAAWYPRVAFSPVRREQELKRPEGEEAAQPAARTVTCAGCGQKGHNRRTCPKG